MGVEEDRVLELMHLCWKMEVSVAVSETEIVAEYMDPGGRVFCEEHPELMLELDRHREWFFEVLGCLYDG